MSQIMIRSAVQADIPAARQVILKVAKSIFGWERSLDEIACMMTQEGELGDIDDIQANYFNQRGTFLVALDGEKVIGTGGIHAYDQDTCELKRLWLLEDYHGKKLGYQITNQLLEFARQQGFQAVRLTTSPKQSRAIQFYRRLGFSLIDGLSAEENFVFQMRL